MEICCGPIAILATAVSAYILRAQFCLGGPSEICNWCGTLTLREGARLLQINKVLVRQAPWSLLVLSASVLTSHLPLSPFDPLCWHLGYEDQRTVQVIRFLTFSLQQAYFFENF